MQATADRAAATDLLLLGAVRLHQAGRTRGAACEPIFPALEPAVAGTGKM